MQISRVKTGLLAVLGLATALFLIYWRIPEEHTSVQAVKAAFVMSAFLFVVSVPCFYLVFRVLFGEFVGLLLTAFHVLLAVFPYRLFYGQEVNLNQICFYPVPATSFGMAGFGMLILYFAVCLVGVCAYWFYKKKRFFPPVEKKPIIICLVLLLAAAVQVAPRLGKHSPKSVKINLHRGEPTTEVAPVTFYGYETGGWDVGYHIGPSGLFRGTFRLAKTAALNRRGFAPYLYSLVSTFVHPYFAAILVNGLFYYLILVAGVLLAAHLGLRSSVAWAFALLLSANYFILFQTIAPYFYIQYIAFILIIVLLLFKLQIFDRPGQVGNQLLFGAVLACCGLTYNPVVFAAIILVWGLLHGIRAFSLSRKSAAITAVQSAALAAVPFCSQFVWESILGRYGLQGTSENTQIRSEVFARILQLPGHLFSNFLEFEETAIRLVTKLVVTNPIVPNPDGEHNLDPQIEYWALLGLLGVVSFFFLLPRYIDKKHRTGLYACYAANLVVPFVTALAATVKPLMDYHYIFHSAVRTNHAYLVLVLSQSIGIYHIVKTVSAKLSIRKVDLIFIGVCVCIYFLSFAKLLLL